MHNPFISQKVKIRLKDGQYRVFANDRINIGENLEACSFIPITKKAISALEKNMCFDLISSLFVNPEELVKEKNTLSKIENSIYEAQSAGISEAGLVNLINQLASTNPIDRFAVGSVLNGFGSLYSKSDEPNVNWTYLPDEKLYLFTAVRTILAGEELVIPKI